MKTITDEMADRLIFELGHNCYNLNDIKKIWKEVGLIEKTALEKAWEIFDILDDTKIPIDSNVWENIKNMVTYFDLAIKELKGE